jgi:hypothetical protein
VWATGTSTAREWVGLESVLSTGPDVDGRTTLVDEQAIRWRGPLGPVCYGGIDSANPNRRGRSVGASIAAAAAHPQRHRRSSHDRIGRNDAEVPFDGRPAVIGEGRGAVALPDAHLASVEVRVDHVGVEWRYVRRLVDRSVRGDVARVESALLRAGTDAAGTHQRARQDSLLDRPRYEDRIDGRWLLGLRARHQQGKHRKQGKPERKPYVRLRHVWSPPRKKQRSNKSYTDRRGSLPPPRASIGFASHVPPARNG